MLVVSLKIHFPEISSSITTLCCATLSSTCPGPIFKPLGVLSPLSPVQPHAIQTTIPLADSETGSERLCRLPKATQRVTC